MAVAALLLASLLLAACGSSSNTTAGTTAAKTAAGAPASGRFAAVRECLQKAGITLPSRGSGTPGAGGPPAGGFGLGGGGGGGPTLPKGVTREQFQNALRKCGGGLGRGGGFGSRLSSPTYRKALASFAACMNKNGVKLPAPNTTGKGPIFNTSGLNANSPAFVAARTKCESLLRARPGTPGTGAGGAPGSSASGA